MIVFDLACACGYTFEGWFQDRRDFEVQQTASFLVCPACNSRDIRKVLSPVRTCSAREEADCTDLASIPESDLPVNITNILETLQKFVEEHFEDVGAELASESLKIHYGVSEPRNIRGVTTETEEIKLREEGINLLKIPLPLKNKDVN